MAKTARYVFLAGLLCAGPALTEEPACSAEGSNGMVSAVLCPAGVAPEAMAEAGRAVCDERVECSAWIWESAEDIPAELPDAHDKLAPAAVQSARAIWINGNQQLIILRAGE